MVIRTVSAETPAISRILFLFVIPDTTLTADFGQRSREAKNSQRAALALPSTGGAVKAIFNEPSKIPAILQRDERGCTRQVMRVQPL